MIEVSGDGILTFQNQHYRCALGKGGLKPASEKREGDGATPLGIYPLRAALYRADKMMAPETELPLFAIQPDDGWCDYPADASYNKLIKLPYAARHEKMWRDDDLYDLVVVIGHNDDPVVAGLGSCIFIHIAKPDYAPTEGCVALTKKDLLSVLIECKYKTEIKITV